MTSPNNIPSVNSNNSGLNTSQTHNEQSDDSDFENIERSPIVTRRNNRSRIAHTSNAVYDDSELFSVRAITSNSARNRIDEQNELYRNSSNRRESLDSDVEDENFSANGML